MKSFRDIAGPYRIRAVLFDFDGTLTLPGYIDFPLIKRDMGCPPDMPVLEFIEGIADPVAKEKAMTILNAHEEKAARCSLPNNGAEDVLVYLKEQGLPIGIITRNSRKAVDLALENFNEIDAGAFDLIVTRDTPVKPKPHGDGVIHAAGVFGVVPEEMLVVGDYIYDIEAGNRAGSVTAFITNGEAQETDSVDSTFIIHALRELKDIVRMGLPLENGKLPNEILEHFFKDFSFSDQSVIINPGVGEDCAAVDIEGEDTLLLKSDPITFVTDSVGKYAVLVNANDIAPTGALPRWFLTTLLFPSGSTASEIYHTMIDLHEISASRKITLCGGHTEITDAVTRPVVSGMMAGTVRRGRLLDKRNMRPGDRIIMTKAVSVEGTSILAREFPERLISGGLTGEEIEEGRGFLDRISILEEAAVISGIDGVRAMHDITEGGLSTAMMELSRAGGYGIAVDMDAIPVYPLTRKMCAILGLAPMGLIGSGSLLICCDCRHSGKILRALHIAGIQAGDIGEVGEGPAGITALRDGRPVEWPLFQVDELARLFRQ